MVYVYHVYHSMLSVKNFGADISALGALFSPDLSLGFPRKKLSLLLSKKNEAL